MKASEDMTDPTTRQSFDSSSALPDSEGHFQVLAAPHVHLFVVGPDLPEVVSVDGEQTSGHGWSRHRRDWIGLAVFLDAVGYVDPEK